MLLKFITLFYRKHFIFPKKNNNYINFEYLFPFSILEKNACCLFFKFSLIGITYEKKIQITYKGILHKMLINSICCKKKYFQMLKKRIN